jgi:catechol-2,3-dioxygenase
VLGLHPVQTDPEVFVPYVTNGKVNVALLPVRDGQQFTPPSHQGPRGCHAAFSASGDSFLAFIERFQREGVPFEMLLHGYCRSIYFEDPDGYVIEVTTYDLDVPKSAE